MEIKKITDNLWEVKAKFSRKSDIKAFEKWLNERFNEQPTKQKGSENMKASIIQKLKEQNNRILLCEKRIADLEKQVQSLQKKMKSVTKSRNQLQILCCLR